MKVRNVALASLLATTLLGVSALPQLALITPVYAEETTGADVQSDQDLAMLASGSAEKEEVIYASMTATGAVKNLYVVNELFSDVPALVKDFGTYNETLNLTNESALAQEPDSVVCVIEEGSFVYQGNLASSELPWNVRITYELDGEPVSPEELAGKSGSLNLSIETDQNEAVDQTYFDNYMLQVTCTLPIDHATKIETEEGQIALSGSNTTVSFTSMPGKESSYSLTAQIKDFEMEGISIAAIPFSMVIDMPDSDAIVSEFDALIEGTNQLQSGASELSTGVSALDNGIQAFDQGASQLQGGASSLSAGVAAYVAGVARISQGLAQAAAGSESFAGKLEELSQTSEGIVQSLDATETQVQELIASIQSSALSESEKAELIQKIVGLSTQLSGLKNYAEGVSQLADGYTELDSSLDQLSAGLAELSQQGDTLIRGSAELNEGIGDLTSSTESLAQGAGQLADGAAQLSEGTTQLHEESQGIPDKVREEIDALMSDYDKSDFELKSFVDERNTNVKLVQFVMTTEAIHVPDAPSEEPEEEDETLLSRFLALFS